jgi:hypothetical protein
MRVCKECKIEKELTEYKLKKNGKVNSSYCKSCYSLIYYHNDKENIKEERRRYYQNNKDEINKKSKLSYQKNKDKISDRKKELYHLNKDKNSNRRKEYYENNKEVIKEKARKYYQDNKDEINEKRKESNRERSLKYYYDNKDVQNKKSVERNKIRMKNDSLFKLSHNIRVLIRKSMQNRFTTKSKKTIEILGCSFEEFKIYLESKFDDKMNWNNQGNYWSLDHIIPISFAKTEEEVYRLNHYTNFQPLYWLDNLKKSNKYNEL